MNWWKRFRKMPVYFLEEPLKGVSGDLEQSARDYYSIYGPPDEWVYQVLARLDLTIVKLWWALTLVAAVAGALGSIAWKYDALAKWWTG